MQVVFTGEAVDGCRFSETSHACPPVTRHRIVIISGIIDSNIKRGESFSQLTQVSAAKRGSLGLSLGCQLSLASAS